MITLQRLKWSNCFSYGADNELDLSSNTVTQLVGTNGMGKSSIPLIIEEALYNKNSKGIKKADFGNISVYAHGHDYHDVMKKRLKRYGRWLVSRTNAKIKVFVDTKSTRPPRRDNIIYKINQKEFEALQPDHIPNSSNCIVTMGANGALWNKKQFQVPIARTFDVTGAGDTFLAALVFYYIQLDSMDESIAFANKAAAIAVENPGTYTLTMEDVDEILR